MATPLRFSAHRDCAPLQCVRIAAGIRPRSPQAERLALPLQASKAFALLQGDIRGIQALVPNNQIARGKRTLFLSVFNNFTARAKIALFASAPSSELSAAFSHCRKAAMLACALRSSSSQKSHSVAIFGNPVVANLRLNPERVNLRDFLIGEALNNRAKREKQRRSRRRVSLRRRTFGCLSNHGNFFHLF